MNHMSGQAMAKTELKLTEAHSLIPGTPDQHQPAHAFEYPLKQQTCMEEMYSLGLLERSNTWEHLALEELQRCATASRDV